MHVRDDDSDIDALLGETIAKVGESPSVIEASKRLQAMIDAANSELPPLVDPRTLPARFTNVKEVAKSAAHYLHSCQNDFEDTIALRMGSAFHASLFENRKVVRYLGRRQGKAWDRFERTWQDENAVILNEAEYGVAMGMIGALRRHDRAMQLLFDGTTREHTILWPRPERAAGCRATPDAFAKDRSVELKSSRCTEPKWFMREALRRFYHVQLGWYDDAIAVELGACPESSYIVACENAKPFNVTVFRLPAETREAAVKLKRLWWERLLAAETTNYYGGYVESDVDLELPANELAEQISFEVDGELFTTA